MVAAGGLLQRCRHHLVVDQAASVAMLLATHPAWPVVVVVARQSMQLLVVRRPLRHSQLQADQQTRVAEVAVLRVVQVWQQEHFQLAA